MADVLMAAYVYDDNGNERRVHGAYWCEGTKRGTKVMVVDRRYLLVRKARRGERHVGTWRCAEDTYDASLL